MGTSKRTLIIICMGWFASVFIVSLVAGYYYMKFQYLAKILEECQNYVLHVNICIDYGNGTLVWHNNTIVPVGCTLLNATKIVAEVTATQYDWGYSVDAINGVHSNSTHFWIWYHWDNETKDWKYGEVASDQYVLSDEETVRWRYEKYS